MKRSLLSLGLCALLATAPLAQTTPPSDKSQRSAEVQVKIQKLSLLIQLLPLALTKPQLSDILLVLDKCRDKEKKILESEDDEILKLETEVDDTYDKAINKGVYPPHPFQSKVYTVTGALSTRRLIARGEMVDDIYQVVTKSLNSGQLKVMANSLEPKLLDPTAKVDDKDESKIRFYIGQVFLDPFAYDLLVQLSRMPGPPPTPPADTSGNPGKSGSR